MLKNKTISYILIIFIYLTSSSFLFFDNDRNINFIPYTSLPLNIQEFVNTYFKDYEIHSAAVSTHYIVIFKGGSSINFNRKGEWTSIIGNRKTIAISTAEKFIEAKIINIIRSKYKTINNIYKKSKGIEFKADDKEYIYIDYEGNIIKIKKA
ncbi:PepSY-like domain-containing protein [Brachyspira hampsonii]|uniref:PepSY-like domain-containing protein n=1 Tax=Brachyspira hampsonii TaxID=1287055 RepID=UPI0009F2426A|nr:PepSY-like domain-containing protein [Brachyspira hampsonii]